MPTETKKTQHTSAPWDEYARIAFLIEDSGGRGVHLSPEDYDHAVRCVNAHDALVYALQAMVACHCEGAPLSESQRVGLEEEARAALKLATE